MRTALSLVLVTLLIALASGCGASPKVAIYHPPTSSGNNNVVGTTNLPNAPAVPTTEIPRPRSNTPPAKTVPKSKSQKTKSLPKKRRRTSPIDKTTALLFLRQPISKTTVLHWVRIEKLFGQKNSHKAQTQAVYFITNSLWLSAQAAQEHVFLSPKLLNQQLKIFEKNFTNQRAFQRYLSMRGENIADVAATIKVHILVAALENPLLVGTKKVARARKIIQKFIISLRNRYRPQTQCRPYLYNPAFCGSKLR